MKFHCTLIVKMYFNHLRYIECIMYVYMRRAPFSNCTLLSYVIPSSHELGYSRYLLLGCIVNTYKMAVTHCYAKIITHMVKRRRKLILLGNVIKMTKWSSSLKLMQTFIDYASDVRISRLSDVMGYHFSATCTGQ